MSFFRLDRLMEFLTSIQLVTALLWIGLAIFTVGLAILMYTRWGQYKPLRKCMAMSLLAHLLMAGYAATVEIITPIPPTVEPVVHVMLGDGPNDKLPPGGAGSEVSQVKDQPWEAFPGETVARPDDVALDKGEADKPVEPKRTVRTEDTKLPGDAAVDHVALADAKSLAPKANAVAEAAGRTSSDQSAETIEAPAAQRRDAPQLKVPSVAVASSKVTHDSTSAQPTRSSSDDMPVALLQQIVPLPKMTESDTISPLSATADAVNGMRLKPVKVVEGSITHDSAYDEGGSAGVGGSSGRMSAPSIAGLSGKGTVGGTSSSGGTGGAELASAGTPDLGLPGLARNRGTGPVPDAYRLRVAPNRAGIAQSHGGTAETEAAVKKALKWLADNQAADGRWDPRAQGAGKESNVLGRNRQNAGATADSAMTGLALLAFLGSGHTHLEGPYHDDIRRGLEYLMQIQAADGNLGGKAASFEFMYSHAMATCALSEAYGLTRDGRLRDAVSRAVAYTAAAQDLKGGGWRYKPGDPGDTSQLGWQLMALKSADLAGIPMSESTRQGIIRYLQSVSSGQYGGHASYRPGEQPTRTMTAEALVCWQFLGLAREHPACNEAGDFVLGELPGEGQSNLYYWYYATLSMYQLQGTHWEHWNNAIRKALVSRQIKEGPLAGSWETNDLWGGHGGRVFTTAIATMTLEVYYRFLPLYAGVPQGGKAKK